MATESGDTSADGTDGGTRSSALRSGHRMPRMWLPPTAGFWCVAASFAAVMAFGTTPTPLWPLYEARGVLDTTTVTLAFGITVVGAAGCFAWLGHLSDRMGRRRIIVPALLISIVAAVVLGLSDTLPGLLLGRFLTGIGIGLMGSTATAYLIDLHRVVHPGRPASSVPVVVAAAANLGGLAMGPLIAGAIAEWGANPLTTSYVVCATAMTILLLLVLAAPETMDVARRTLERAPRFAMEPGQGALFALAGVIGFFVYAMMGLFSSLGSIIVHDRIGIPSYFVAALIPFAVFAASAVTQLALARIPQAPLLVLGVLLFSTGFGLTTIAVYQPTASASALWCSLAGAAVCGVGAGLLFKAAVEQSAVAARPGSRAGVLAIFFVISFLGMGIPPVAFGALLQAAGVRVAMAVFAAVLSAGVVLAGILSLHLGARSAADAARGASLQ